MPQSQSVNEQKQWQRLRGRSALTAFDPKRRDPASAAIRARLEKIDGWRTGRRLVLFAPFPTEPNPGWPAEPTVPGADGNPLDRELFFPRTVFNPPAISLHHVRTPAELLPIPAAKNIVFLEPAPDAPEADYDAIDAILVPGLAFDREGYRLGRGGGFYDRLLARLPERTVRIGLFFAVQELAQIVREPHDRRLDWIVTEKEHFHTHSSPNLPPPSHD